MRCRYARRAKITRYAPADTEIPQLKKVTQLKNIISFLGVKKTSVFPRKTKIPPPADNKKKFARRMYIHSDGCDGKILKF